MREEEAMLRKILREREKQLIEENKKRLEAEEAEQAQLLKAELQWRLEELRREFEAGQAQLCELEAEGSRLRNKLLIIGSAIELLEKELAVEAQEGNGSAIRTQSPESGI